MKEYKSLAELRKENGFTSTYVASKLGITRNCYYKKENLQSPVRLFEVYMLSDMFKQDPDVIEKLCKTK